MLRRTNYTYVDPVLPKEQVGFRRGRSTVDQVALLTQKIKNSFQPTILYSTTQAEKLICKIIRLFSNRHMVLLIMKLGRIELLPSPPAPESKVDATP